MTEHVPEPIGPFDVAAITALARDAGWPHREADIAGALALGRGLAMREAGVLVACGGWWPWGDAAATLGLVMVRGDRQGRGLGGRMMERLLADAGPRAVLLFATEAGLALYERSGFDAAYAVRQLQGECHVEPEKHHTVRTLRDADRRAVTGLDANAFGAPRDRLIASLLDAGEAMVLDTPEGIAGFGVRRPFGRGAVIGPLVAGDEDAAVTLLRALLRPGFMRIDVPDAATRVGAAAIAAGLGEVDQGVAMVRGRWPGTGTGRRMRTFALASQALG